MLFILIILIIFYFIFSISGLTYLIPFILAICNFILSSLSLITNRNNLISRFIQLISLSYIIFVIIINTIELTDNITNLSYCSIIYLRDFKYRRRCFVFNERTKFLYYNDLNNIKNTFLNNLNNNQNYLIKLKYQFLLNSKEIFTDSMSNPIIITNQIDSKELIDLIEDEIMLLFDINKLDTNSTSSWKDDLKIEIIYYKLGNY